MNNFEWLKNEIADADKDTLYKIFNNELPWCSDECSHDYPHGCEECANKWFEEIHEEPMPELKVGMFVKVNNEHNTDLGIIVNNKYVDGLVVAYHGGGFDLIRNVIIEAIYNTVGFDFCNNNTCIWRRSE